MARRLALLCLPIVLCLALGTSSALAVQTGSLTVQKAGNGYVAGPGIDCGSTCTQSYQYSDCDTSVVPPLCFPQDVTVTASDANGFHFDHWSGCDFVSGNDCTKSATTFNPTVTATFLDVQAPTVSLTGPVASAVNGSITLTAAASDNAGVARVDFSVDGNQIGSDTTAPYASPAYDTTKHFDGPATLSAVAYDAAGNVSSASQRTVTFDNSAPLLSLTGPSGGTFYPLGSTQSWTVAASDAYTSVASLTCSIDGATPTACPTTVTVTNAPAGQHQLDVYGTDQLGNAAHLTATWNISATPVNTAKPTVTGTAEPGQTLTATQGTWNNTATGTAFTYTWQRCSSTGTNCADIVAAVHQAQYQITSADLGHKLRIKVTASNVAGTVSATSAPTKVVGLPLLVQAPVISGVATVGHQLTATTGTWQQSPTSYSYAWQRCSSTGTACVAIGTADATDDNDYTLVAADAGHRIKVVVTATNAYGSAGGTSKGTAIVT